MTILVVGGEGLTSEVTKAGFVVTRSALDAPAAVIQGFSPDVGWVHLAEAAYALQGGGVVWVATNTDWTIPQARGTAPGNGTLVSAVHTAVGQLPVVAGKPEVAIFEEALSRGGTTVKSGEVYYYLVSTLIEEGRTAEARKKFETFGQQIPQNLRGSLEAGLARAPAK